MPSLKGERPFGSSVRALRLGFLWTGFSSGCFRVVAEEDLGLPIAAPLNEFHLTVNASLISKLSTPLIRIRFPIFRRLSRYAAGDRRCAPFSPLLPQIWPQGNLRKGRRVLHQDVDAMAKYFEAFQ